jgi:branched-chain amino acid transport system ATP-binding protein
MTAESAEVDLRVEDLHVRYGGVHAVQGISFAVRHQQVVALLGANGAGKSSTLNALAGSNPGSVSGLITLHGRRLARPRADRVARSGMILIPEGRQVFAPLTVEDNLRVGGYLQRSRRRLKGLLAEVYELFPILAERRNAPAGMLSGGEQQMLAFGRALMSQPRLILMDEPSMGLAPIMVDRVMSAITAMNERGVSILLVEQNAVAALRVASYAYVLERGQVVSSGEAARLSDDPIVAEAFLGTRSQPAAGAQSEAVPGAAEG